VSTCCACLSAQKSLLRLRSVQADEFVAEVERGTVEALLQRAAASHPTCTLALLIEGLHHYLQQRERSEFRCSRRLPPWTQLCAAAKVHYTLLNLL
jgi:hypothetical protein